MPHIDAPSNMPTGRAERLLFVQWHPVTEVLVLDRIYKGSAHPRNAYQAGSGDSHDRLQTEANRLSGGNN